MPPLLRFGCAGVAVIAIAALTSVGLFAVVAGGLPFGGPSARTAANQAPVLVTIQAAPATPTVPPPPTATETPVSLLPVLVTAARAAPATNGPAPPAAPSPAAPNVGRGEPPPAGPPEAERIVAHDGLVLEVAQAERRWQPPTEMGQPAPRDGELVAVQLRFANRAGEVRFVADADVLLVGEDGARYPARTAAPRREPHLLTVPLTANDAIRGWLTYEVPTGTALRGIQWSPTRPDRPRAETTYVLALPRDLAR